MQISLDPLSATPYFTWGDHRMAMRGRADARAGNGRHAMADNLMIQIRTLLQMPDSWNLSIRTADDRFGPDYLVDPSEGTLFSEPYTPAATGRNLDASFAVPAHVVPWDSCGRVRLRLSGALGIPIQATLECTAPGTESGEALPPSLTDEDLYLVWKVLEDLNRRSAEVIRRETAYKSAVLVQAVARHGRMRLLQPDPAKRSLTVLGLIIEGGGATEFQQFLQKQNLQAGLREDRILLANYPTHSKETFEWLSDLIGNWG